VQLVIFYLYLTLHVCVQKFNVTGNLEKKLRIKQGLNYVMAYHTIGATRRMVSVNHKYSNSFFSYNLSNNSDVYIEM
jgi:hypothetical protein